MLKCIKTLANAHFYPMHIKYILYFIYLPILIHMHLHMIPCVFMREMCIIQSWLDKHIGVTASHDYNTRVEEFIVLLLWPVKSKWLPHILVQTQWVAHKSYLRFCFWHLNLLDWIIFRHAQQREWMALIPRSHI